MSTTFNPTDIYNINNTRSSGSTNNGNYWQMPSYNSGASSVAGYQFPDLTGAVQGQRNATQGMLGSQDQSVGNYLSSYANAINSQETAPAMWARLANETGFNRYNKMAVDTENQLAAIPQTEIAATRGFDVNANQLDRIMNMETWKLAPIAQRAAAQAQNAAGLMTNQMSLGQQQQMKELLPYQTEQQFLMDRIARETSMFSQQNQEELNALTAKMSAGVTLTNAEQDRLNALKIQQMMYDQAIATAKIGSQVALWPGQTLFNPYTTTGGAYSPAINGLYAGK